MCILFFFIFTDLFSGSSKQYRPWELGRVNEQFLHDLSDKDYPPYGIYNSAGSWENKGAYSHFKILAFLYGRIT